MPARRNHLANRPARDWRADERGSRIAGAAAALEAGHDDRCQCGLQESVSLGECVVQPGAFFKFTLINRSGLREDGGRFTAVRAQGFDFTGKAGCASNGQDRF